MHSQVEPGESGDEHPYPFNPINNAPRLVFSIGAECGMVVKLVKVATTLEVPPGVMRMIQVADQEVCLANVDGKCYAIGNVYTHEEGPLDQGRLEEYEVECPWHGSRFDIRNRTGNNGPRLKT